MDKQKEKSVRTLLEQRREQFRKEEEAHKKELEELARQVKMEDGKEPTEAMTTVVSSDDHVRERLGDFSVEEGKLIGKYIVKEFDALIDKSMAEINALRKKKSDREARRKERQARKKAEQSAADSAVKAAPQSEPKPERKPEPMQVQRPATPVQNPVQPPVQNVPRPGQGNGIPMQQGAPQAQPNGGIRYVPNAQR